MMKKNLSNIIVSNADEKVNAYQSLLDAYAIECKDTTAQAYAKALTDLATATAYSVLKKCIDKAYNPTLVSVRTELTRDTHDLDRLTYANANAYDTAYNADGERVRVTADTQCAKALDELAHTTLGDGLDLVHTAIVAILDETNKQTERGEAVDLERPYSIRRLSRKVWIKAEDSAHGWEDAETTPIREIYKAVRRAIDASRAAATDPRNGYSYIDELTTDAETGATDTIYRRLAKYADLGGYATDYNGATTFYGVDNATVELYDDMVEKLALTPSQRQILTLRQSGYGNKAIATYLGRSENSIKGAITEIRRKARSRGVEYIKTPGKREDIAADIVNDLFGGIDPTEEGIEYAYKRGLITEDELTALYTYHDRH